MSRVRHVFGLLGLLILPGLAAAGQRDVHHTFAICTGRLAAQAEHERSLNAAQADATEALLAHFRELMEATAVQANWRETIDMRVRAKLAHRAILMRAQASAQPKDAKWADRRARQEIARCNALILNGS